MSNDHASVQIHEICQKTWKNTHTQKNVLLISRPKDISFDLLACISGAPNQVSTGILLFNY